jgi:hypothetical protein
LRSTVEPLGRFLTLVEATPLFVDRTNDIIRDAKDIVKNAVYLDRITSSLDCDHLFSALGPVSAGGPRIPIAPRFAAK